MTNCKSAGQKREQDEMPLFGNLNESESED
jgi:hypothetical protein